MGYFHCFNKHLCFVDMLCEQGGLVVYDGANNSADVMGRYCGKRFAWSLITTGSDIYLHLDGVLFNNDLHVITFEYNALSELA